MVMLLRRRTVELMNVNSKPVNMHLLYLSVLLNIVADGTQPIRTDAVTVENYTFPLENGTFMLYERTDGEGKLLDEANQPSATLSFINNGIAFLFDEIRYEIGGYVIDRVRNPGITSTMKGYVSYAENESGKLLNAGWCPLENPKLTDTKGNFSVCIPLKMLLGFAEDYNKIIMNVRQELILLRSNTDLNSILTNKADEKPKIVLTKIFWKVPHISVGDVEKDKLLGYIDSGKYLDIAFRSWELQEYPLLQETMKHGPSKLQISMEEVHNEELLGNMTENADGKRKRKNVKPHAVETTTPTTTTMKEVRQRKRKRKHVKPHAVETTTPTPTTTTTMKEQPLVIV
ncbi:hypothetical protein NQ318_022820 [Aromia moschata]|uniref:Double jelly roll-like domain-containing protein n=1 Tax=Aromia moschata TaxID=1265417 RepID=A0AAV8XKU1_9CUCU|nr:hypothetical protein NQ318_022820 [Aromia moschata]